MTVIENGWQILNRSNREYLHLQHNDHPGYITIKVGAVGFSVDIWPDVGNEADASMYSFYDDLQEAKDE